MKLEIGYNSSFEVRHEQCGSSPGAGFTVLYLSDLHFSKFSGPITEKIIATINALQPGIILLGGDYVDTKKGLIHLNRLLQSLAHHKNIFAVAGNHDYYFGLKIIKKFMAANNINWIENDSASFELNGKTIQIDGNRASLKNNNADFSILCLHKPADVKSFAGDYDLIFAGHLHGGQFIFWQTAKGLYPGKLFYRWNMLKTTFPGCNYFISKGMGDTLPMRFNCAKDMIFVQISDSTLL